VAHVLNLDEIETGLERTVVLGGKNYPLKPMSVEDYIAQLKDAQAAEKEQDTVKLFELMVNSVGRAFPSMKEGVIRKLTVAQLQKLMAFVQSVAEEETKEGK
jgi:hypothetical protein